MGSVLNKLSSNKNIVLCCVFLSLYVVSVNVNALDCPPDHVLDTALDPPQCKFVPIRPVKKLAVAIDPNSSYELTVGFNPLSSNRDRLIDENGNPSDWTSTTLLAGESCDQNSNEITLDGYVRSVANYHINRSFPGCSSPDGFDYTTTDPRSIASLSWIDFGLVADPEGTMETINCKFSDDCGFTTIKTETNGSLMTINPTQGGSPLSAGKTTALVYNYNNLYHSNSLGFPGVGGKANISNIPTSIKYCYKKRDATTEPELTMSSFAKEPVLEFMKINWSPFTQGVGANDGSVSGTTAGKTTVIKGIDSSVRYWIGEDNVLGK